MLLSVFLLFSYFPKTYAIDNDDEITFMGDLEEEIDPDSENHDWFTSSTDLKRLFSIELKLVKVLKKYLKQEEANLIKIRRLKNYISCNLIIIN